MVCQVRKLRLRIYHRHIICIFFSFRYFLRFSLVYAFFNFFFFSYGSRFLILIIYPFSVLFFISLAFLYTRYIYIRVRPGICLEGAVSRRAWLYVLEHLIRHETTTNAHSNVDRQRKAERESCALCTRIIAITYMTMIWMTIYTTIYLIDDNFANKTIYSDLLKSQSRRKIYRVIHLNLNRQIFRKLYQKFSK